MSPDFSIFNQKMSSVQSCNHFKLAILNNKTHGQRYEYLENSVSIQSNCAVFVVNIQISGIRHFIVAMTMFLFYMHLEKTGFNHHIPFKKLLLPAVFHSTIQNSPIAKSRSNNINLNT